MLAIDEVQRVPEMVLALKLVVDRDPRPGRFLLTGSADLLRLPATRDSLVGRAESIELHGFSQGELAGHREQFIDRLLNGDAFLGHESTLGRVDYLRLDMAGGYPEALTRAPGRRRNSGWTTTLELLETLYLVAGELRRQLGWAEESVRVSHYRDRAGAEVDLILESDDGRVAGVEVKAAASVGARDAKWLLELRDKLGRRFSAGVILHAGRTSAPFGDRVSAVPLDVLWTA